MSEQATTDTYPKTVTLPDGMTVELRRMTAADRDPVLQFAQSLPQEDLLFLRVDITQEDVVDEWINNLSSGHSTSLAAYDSNGFIGYASLHRNPTTWTRHMAQ